MVPQGLALKLYKKSTCFSLYDRNGHIKQKISICKVLLHPFKQAERDVLLRMSHVTMTTLLHVRGFHTPNSNFWVSHLQNFIHVSNFSTHLYQINPSI